MISDFLMFAITKNFCIKMERFCHTKLKIVPYRQNGTDREKDNERKRKFSEKRKIMVHCIEGCA